MTTIDIFRKWKNNAQIENVLLFNSDALRRNYLPQSVAQQGVTFYLPLGQPSASRTYKRNSILIAYGPNIKQRVEIEGTKIHEMAATIPHMFRLPVPDDRNGKVQKEIFRKGSKPAQIEVAYQKVGGKRQRVKDRIENLKRLSKL